VPCASVMLGKMSENSLFEKKVAFIANFCTIANFYSIPDCAIASFDFNLLFLCDRRKPKIHLQVD